MNVHAGPDQVFTIWVTVVLIRDTCLWWTTIDDLCSLGNAKEFGNCQCPIAKEPSYFKTIHTGSV